MIETGIHRVYHVSQHNKSGAANQWSWPELMALLGKSAKKQVVVPIVGCTILHCLTYSIGFEGSSTDSSDMSSMYLNPDFPSG